MRILKTNSLLRLFNSYLVDSPQPANISYLWNFFVKQKKSIFNINENSFIFIIYLIYFLINASIYIIINTSIYLIKNASIYIKINTNYGYSQLFSLINYLIWIAVQIHIHSERLGLYLKIIILNKNNQIQINKHETLNFYQSRIYNLSRIFLFMFIFNIAIFTLLIKKNSQKIRNYSNVGDSKLGLILDFDLKLDNIKNNNINTNTNTNINKDINTNSNTNTDTDTDTDTDTNININTPINTNTNTNTSTNTNTNIDTNTNTNTDINTHKNIYTNKFKNEIKEDKNNIQNQINSFALNSNNLDNFKLNKILNKELVKVELNKNNNEIFKKELDKEELNKYNNMDINIQNNKIDIQDNIFNNMLNNEYIKNILNKNNLNINLISEIEDQLPIIGLILDIVNDGIVNKDLLQILDEVYIKFEKIGVDKKITKKILAYYLDFNDQISDSVKNEYNNMIEDVLNEVKNIVKVKEVTLSDKTITRLRKILFLGYRFTMILDLHKKLDQFILNLIKELESNSKENLKMKGGRKKKSLRTMSPSDYKKSFSATIENEVYEFKNYIINLILKTYSNKLNSILNDLDTLNKVLLKNYKINIKNIIDKNYNLNYNRESMWLVNAKKQNLKISKLEDFNTDSVKNLESINSLFKKSANLVKEMEIKNIDNKLIKLNIDEPLGKILSEIINNNKISLEARQIAIENACLEYDLNWFKNEMKNSLDARFVLLHDIYNNFNNGLKFIIQPFIKHNYLNLNKDLKKILIINEKITVKEYISDNERKLISKITNLLVIFILGNDYIISTAFKTLIEIITKTDRKMQVNRTELVFTIGNKLIKLCNYQLKINLIQFKDKKDKKDKNNNINKNWVNVQNILKIINLEDINNLINNFNELDKFNLGDTIVRLLEDKTKVLTRNLETNFNNHREILISISEEYLNKLNISCINITQLPMLIKPNNPTNEGFYAPYVKGEISHIYNTFDTIIKNKYDLRDKVENQEVLNNTIKYLNNTRFSINKEVLDFVLTEWNNENSLLFKGENKLLIIDSKDSKDIVKIKQSNNSKYWRHLNTINIAKLYCNSNFYLPTFADFRGRIYTLTNYLSYQSDDLSRSLILFNPEIKEKYLNEKGLNYLFYYFANLAGKDSLSYKKRIEFSKNNFVQIYNNYIENKDKFNDLFLSKLKEPFQFISIMLIIAKILVYNKTNKKIIVNNPILFDASCNGLQHLSALTREINIAIETNLIKDNSNGKNNDLPKDFYNFAGNIIQNKIDNSNIENITKLNLNRSLIKKTVMTIPYNISLFGVKEQLEDKFTICKVGNKTFYKVPVEFTKDNKDLFLYPNEIMKLADLIYNGLIDNLPSLRILNLYLDQMLNILLNLNKPIVWITPSGLKISLSTLKFKSIKLASSLIPYGKPVTISLPTNSLNHSKIKRSFMPNLIHSLDASNVHLLCDKLANKPLYTIHDCFATTANHMEDLENDIKKAFIEIYFSNGNYLEKMHNSLIDQIKSYNNNIISKNNNEYIQINKTEFLIPKIPDSFIDPKLIKIFINGIKKCKYFIS